MSEINGALSGLKIVACSTAQAGTVPACAVEHATIFNPDRAPIISLIFTSNFPLIWAYYIYLLV